MLIDVYSHGFRVSRLDEATKRYAFMLCRFLGQPEFRPLPEGGYEKFISCVYAGTTANRSEFWFHRSNLDQFLGIVRNYSPHLAPEIVEHPVQPGATLPFRLIDTRPPRDYQVAPIAYTVAPGRVKMVTLGPGRGKTFVLNRAIVEMGKRVVFVIKPMYIDKWIGDVESAMEIKAGELLVVKGSKDLINLMKLADLGQMDQVKVILISNATYRIYLSQFEEHGERALKQIGYTYTPIELIPALQAGMLAVDEVHQDFHFNFRLAIYSHVEKLACLSGTLDPDDPFKKEMTRLLFPVKDRFVEPKAEPYIRCAALEFSLRNPRQMKWTNRGRTDYSQTAFEKSICRQKGVLNRYLDMIEEVVRTAFIPQYKPGYKMLIFSGFTQMTGHIRDRLKEKFPQLNVLRYIGEDPFKHTQEADILSTTIKSCGTAIDIPGALVTLMTDALGSSQGNQQVLKRLRPLPEGSQETPEFLYFMCRDIPQHVKYHQHKLELFKGEVKSHQVFVTDHSI